MGGSGKRKGKQHHAFETENCDRRHTACRGSGIGCQSGNSHLMLVDAKYGRVVYSVMKELEFGDGAAALLIVWLQAGISRVKTGGNTGAGPETFRVTFDRGACYENPVLGNPLTIAYYFWRL